MDQNISIRKISPSNSSDLNTFLNFPLKLYGYNAKTENSIMKTAQLVAAGRGYDFFLAVKGGEVCGRMALGSNPDICDPQGIPYGQAGLFEVIEDFKIFSVMIDFAKGCFKERNTLLFPFYISTWYQYRFISNGFDTFKFFMETENKEYYSEFTKRYGVEEVIYYRSYLENEIDSLLNQNKKAYDKAIESGIRFRELNKSDIYNEMKVIYDLSIKGFTDNLFYTEITFPAFNELYSASIKFLDADSFTFACNENGEPVGFIFCSPDYSFLFDKLNMYSIIGKLKFLLFRGRAKGTIIKTTTVLPEYRNRGIFGALTYIQGKVAKKRKYNYMIGAFVFLGNYPARVFTDNKTEKEYELYRISTKTDHAVQ